MLICSSHSATKVDANCLNAAFLTQYVLDLHDCFNCKPFPSEIEVLSGLIPMCSMIYKSFKQDVPHFNSIDVPCQHIDCKFDSKDVILGFSSGLDSVYQAILLKEQGYDVHLLFAKGINTYENGQAWKYAKPIADKIGVDLISVDVKKNLSKDLLKNPFRQQWPENPIKNEFIMSVMLDICLERGWRHISLGDDFDLTLDKSVPGVNTTDAKEVTMSFLSGIEKYVAGFDFISIPKGHDKGVRLQKLIDYGLEDLYYSCVQAGCRNKYFKSMTEKKFNVKLFGNNCGKCRKCCMHNLILHYTNKKIIPDDYVSYCWEKMYTTGCKADYEFFKPELSLEERINNLFSY